MKKFNELTNAELDLTAEAALAKVNLSETEIKELLDQLNDEQVTEGVKFEFNIIETNFKTVLEQAENYFSSNLKQIVKERIFGDFWNNFNKKSKQIICKSQLIIDFINNDGKLTIKETLRYLIPIIATALGFAAINPLALAIIIGILALITKIGFNAYCNI